MAVNYIRRKKGLRNWARSNGVERPQGFNPETNVFGKPARELVRRVKRKAGIRPVSGAWTRKLNILIFPLSYGQLVAHVAKGKIGVRERGYSNSGKWVDIFLDAVYLPGGYAWCAAFAIWCHIRAAIIQDVLDDRTDDYNRLRRIMADLFYGNAAYVPNMERAFRERRKVHGWKARKISWKNVRAGDLIICWGSAHVEIATGPVRDGYVPTIGGNTSASGSQDNGGEVVAKRRQIGSEATSAGRIVPPKG